MVIMLGPTLTQLTDYQHRLQTMDRAQIAGIDDVGIGALFGLVNYRFEVMALLMHAQHLESAFGAGNYSKPIVKESTLVDETAYRTAYNLHPAYEACGSCSRRNQTTCTR